MFSQNQSAGHQHICGLYYNVRPHAWQIVKTYLPLVELEAHATILATTSRTVLTQTFLNPSVEKGIKQVRYTFPLYDGVSVVGFTCHVEDRKIVGVVKEKDKAKAVFKEAVARGETAGLLEQLPDASDVFSTTVGNIPPGAQIIINITYLGELKHDMEVDGIRYTIPSIICPRYGSYTGALHTSDSTESCGKSIRITVDVDMADGSFIQKIQSPSHSIAMTMGTTSVAPRAEPTMHKASISLTLGTSSLETDFVLQIVAKDSGVPKAVLENHPTIPNSRALMTTLVPKFTLPAEKPELVFLCDRSGSMENTRITLAIQALKVFLKSLPIGVKFNICSFGSTHSFLWPRSVTYSQDSLNQAIQHVTHFSANYWGTEMLAPLKATIEQRYQDMPLDVMLLTDGEIWNQQDLFSYLNEVVGKSKAPIRVFTLGVGNGVSHALIEGIAKAGNGFSQSVGEGEMMDTKVVRMLKGALSPHISDYTLEVMYGAASAAGDDGFEMVEKVADSLKVKLDLGSPDQPEKPISLFDTSADPDKEEAPVQDDTGESRYSHLPKVSAPKILQAPPVIPSLFAFNRTTVYLLLGPEAPQATPKSVFLRGTSSHGPLELEIPVQVLGVPGETIHQLAAKKAISELEQGRGWLSEARDGSNTLLSTRFDGQFDDMVEREAVRLGVQFQVGGKWGAFVAVESHTNSVQNTKKDSQDWDWLDSGSSDTNDAQFRAAVSGAHMPHSLGQAFLPRVAGPFSSGQMLFRQQASQMQQMAQQPSIAPAPTAFTSRSGPLFGTANAPPTSFSFGNVSATSPGSGLFGGPKPISPASGLFGSPNTVSPGSGLFGSAQPASPRSGLFGSAQPVSGLFGRAMPSPPSPSLFGSASTSTSPPPNDAKALQDYPTPSASSVPEASPTPTLTTPAALLHHLIALQSFSGSWPHTPALTLVFTALCLPLDRLAPADGASPEEVATAVVVALLEERMQALQGSWELVVGKARAWLEEQGRAGLVDVVRHVVSKAAQTGEGE